MFILILRKQKNMMKRKKGELIKNALVYLNMKYGYSIKEDIFKQFEEIDFDEDKKKWLKMNLINIW